MSFLKLPTQWKDTYEEFPRPFWTLVVVTFIDRLGGALLFPFFALYITSKFGVGMMQVGVLLPRSHFPVSLGRSWVEPSLTASVEKACSSSAWFRPR